MAKELGYKTVFWSLAYVDWNNDSQPSREQAMSKLIPRIHNGAVVLLHSTSRTNAQILEELLAPEGVSIVDPAMADHGKLYRGFDDAYAAAMKELCVRADLMLPNITEAAMMTGMPFLEEYGPDYIQELLAKLAGNDVVLTIDEVIQHTAEKYLEEAVIENQVVNRGVALVMDVETGDILAMAIV